ncbi:uncharacterized protein LOC130648259 [Hydractinia symbiolongicarpus]|uniref:uncharacterized protein LOC130648259 n=1 Tax=Hydractinia symbiolongicarpus TaxID=13093 RepID=UPI00254E405C|nr:uncharacterized protein LOC130648259 [Hydractinia symbiolongicarpus]
MHTRVSSVLEFRKTQPRKRSDRNLTEIAVSRSVDEALATRITTLERRCFSNEQYSRRECVEVTGIDELVGDDYIEEKLCHILKKIDIDITPDNIKACHRLKKRDRVIVKFSRRKDCLETLFNRSKLKNIDGRVFDLSAGTKIYINESLCSYYKNIWNKCKNYGNESSYSLSA